MTRINNQIRVALGATVILIILVATIL